MCFYYLKFLVSLSENSNVGEPFERYWGKEEREALYLSGCSPSAFLSELIGIKPSPTLKDPLYGKRTKMRSYPTLRWDITLE